VKTSVARAARFQQSCQAINRVISFVTFLNITSCSAAKAVQKKINKNINDFYSSRAILSEV